MRLPRTTFATDGSGNVLANSSVRDDGGEGVAVISVARPGLDLGHELSAAAAVQGVATETLTPNS
jgi:hypothetical protein